MGDLRAAGSSYPARGVMKRNTAPMVLLEGGLRLGGGLEEESLSVSVCGELLGPRTQA